MHWSGRRASRSTLTLTVSSSAPIGRFAPLMRKASSYGNARRQTSCGRSTSPATAGLVVAAYDDGTIRWHRMDDGRELLALQVLSDKKNWVAWTPEGFYDATPGAFGVLKWHVNRGNDAAADAVPVSAIPRLKRPDALPLVLQELETDRALGIADLAAARSDVQVATGAAVAPGAQLAYSRYRYQ